MSPRKSLSPTPGTISSLPLIELSGGGMGFVTGCRIPKSYFRTQGFGETESGGGVNPWETGSYDLALEMAGMEDFNVMAYTSVMPPESHEVSAVEARTHYSHGAVLEVIMSQMNGVKGDRLSVGVATCCVTRKRDGKSVGGYAAEYEGHAKEESVKSILTDDLKEIFDRRFSTDEYEMSAPTFTIMVHEVAKAFGTVLAAICFTSYIHPILSINEKLKDKITLEERSAGKHSAAEAGIEEKPSKKKTRS